MKDYENSMNIYPTLLCINMFFLAKQKAPAFAKALQQEKLTRFKFSPLMVPAGPYTDKFSK